MSKSIFDNVNFTCQELLTFGVCLTDPTNPSSADPFLTKLVKNAVKSTRISQIYSSISDVRNSTDSFHQGAPEISLSESPNLEIVPVNYEKASECLVELEARFHKETDKPRQRGEHRSRNSNCSRGFQQVRK